MEASELELARTISAKRIDVILLGAAVTPERASEILRRTDLAGRRLRYLRPDARGQEIRRRLGFPQALDLGGEEAIADWRRRWDAIDLEWLFNNQVLEGAGWCHADGTLAWATELEDYPPASELLEDCRRLAAAFPDLAMDVAIWGHEPARPDGPLMDAPLSPWTAPLAARTRRPSLGLQIEAGQVAAFLGPDPRLFRRFGLTPAEAVEAALRDVRGSPNGVSDDLLEGWVGLARARGLVA